ncbi:MAG: ATP-binding cassette domain-containing protein [Brooklawnia sp.]|jgi:ABC-2 type transport system ATP-binding protein
MTAIEVAGLVKQFKQQRALDGLSFSVPTGSTFGFLGPNGSGKTTTIRILLGLARPDAGTASVLGLDALAHPNQVHPQIGFVPDVPSFYPWMTAPQYLRFSASLFQLDARTTDRRVGLLLELAGLTGVRTPIGGYSRGMKQRLGIVQALINAPRLLILDEPTSALDPMGRHDVLTLLAGLRQATTVFFSTHILGDVERVCDQVAILAAGRVVAAEPTRQLRARYGGAQRVLLELAEAPVPLADALRGEPWLTGLRADRDRWILEVADLAAAQHRLPGIIAAHGWGLRRMEPFEATLEEAFVRLIASGEQAS